jgi:hypothetical protein
MKYIEPLPGEGLALTTANPLGKRVTGSRKPTAVKPHLKVSFKRRSGWVG